METAPRTSPAAATASRWPSAAFAATILLGGLPAVPGAAGGEQGDFALVWRLPGRLDDLHVVLSRRCCSGAICTPTSCSAGSPAAAGGRPPGAGRRGVGGAAHRARPAVEAGRRLESDLADSVAAGGDGGASLFRPFGHQPTGPGLVQPRLSRPVPLPALRAVELRLAGRAAELIRSWSSRRWVSRVSRPPGPARSCSTRVALRGEPGLACGGVAPEIPKSQLPNQKILRTTGH